MIAETCLEIVANLRCPRTRHDHATCAVCGGRACGFCDRCHGCRRVICESCNLTMPRTRFPGDSTPHPHNAADEPRDG